MSFKFKAFTLDIVEAINRGLDVLEEIKGPLGLITTSNLERIYSAGIDFSTFGVSRFYSTTFLMQF